MTLTLFDPQLEVFERAYRALLQTHMTDALTAVAAYWTTAGDPLALPAVASWPEGVIPEDQVLDVADDYPAITLEAVTLEPTDAPTLGVSTLLVRIYTLGDTVAEAHKLTHRYALAVATILTNERPLGIGIKVVGKLTIVVAETITTDDGLFFKEAQVIVPLSVGAVL